jgi:hypothetical protein
MKKKQKLLPPFSFTIKDPIFLGSFFIIFADSQRCSDILFKRYKLRDSSINDSFCGLTIEVSNGICSEVIVWFNEAGSNFRVDDLNDVCTITHESLHAVSKVLTNRGVKMVCESEETYAYYHTWLMTEILKRLEKRK